MNVKMMQDTYKQQKDLAEILSLIKDRGYELSEREKGRIEQMLIDSFLNSCIQSKDRLPNTT